MGTRHPLNILVTGVPGTGKTSFCKAFIQRFPSFIHVNVADLIRSNNLFEEWDDDYDASIYDKKRVKKFLKKLVLDQPTVDKIFDFHGCDVLSHITIDLVIILRASTMQVYDRLQARQYSRKKIQENIQCEIFNVASDDAKSTFCKAHFLEHTNDTKVEQIFILDEASKWLSNMNRPMMTSENVL